MANVTSKQLREMSIFFGGFSAYLLKYQLDNWEKLTDESQNVLESFEKRLRGLSCKIRAMAIIISVDELKVPLEKIENATKEGKKAVKKINNIKKAIKLAKSAVSMGVAILSKDPGKIIKAATGLYNEAKD